MNWNVFQKKHIPVLMTQNSPGLFCVEIQKTGYYLCMLCLASVPWGGPASFCSVLEEQEDSGCKYTCLNLNYVDVHNEFNGGCLSFTFTLFCLRGIVNNKSAAE